MRPRTTSWTWAGLLLGLLVPSPVLAAGGQAVSDYRQLQFPRQHDIVVPPVERLTLPNGMRLFLLENHELPLVRLSARLRVGSIYEPAGKTGLAALTGEVLRTGGTAGRTGDEIDEQLERLAASVEIHIGLEAGEVSVSALSKDIDTALTLLADILMNPAFRDEKIALAKLQLRSAVARRNDTSAAIASREYGKLIYGSDSVYARQAEYATIDSLTREDLVAFHKRYFGPNGMMLAAWGDLPVREMTAKIAQAFRGWEKIAADLPEIPKVDDQYRATVNLIHKADVNQSEIFLGHIGGLISDSDYFALTVMNRILGGGLAGRLGRKLRSREGLAYAVGGAYNMDYAHPGVFVVGCRTRSGRTVSAIRSLVEEVQRMCQEEVAEEELALAKESYLNSFLFHFSAEEDILDCLMTYEYYGYPADFLQKTQERIEQVTKADVLRAARRHLRPDKLQFLVVGRAEDFDEPLSVLGEVREIDITIPGPRPSGERP